MPIFLWSSNTKIDSALLELKNYSKDTLSEEFALLLFEVGQSYINDEFYFDGLKFYERSLKIAELTNNKALVLKNLILIGVANFWILKSDQAIFHLNKALTDFPDLVSSKDSAVIYMTLGNVYYDLEKTHLSYQYTLKGLEILPDRNDAQVIADGYYTLAKMDFDQKNYDSALENINRSITTYKELNRHRDLTYAYDVLAEIYLATKRYELALEYLYLSCVDVDNDYANYFNSYCIHFEARIFEAMGDLEKAERLYQDAISIMEKSDQYGEMLDSKNSLGRLYSLKGECAKSISLLENCIVEAKKLNSRPLIRDIYYTLFEVHNRCENYKEAIGYLKNHNELKDSLMSESNLEELAQLTSSYESHQQKQELSILQKEKKLRSLYDYIIGGTALGLLLFLLFGWWSFRKQSKQNRLLETKNKTIENQNKKLTSTVHQLKSANEELKQFAYVVSHDLKSPLRGISSLANFIEDDLKDEITVETKKEIFDNLDLLKGRVNRMNNLIKGILEYSRVGRKEEIKEKINFNDLISNVLEMVNPPENCTIEIPSKLPKIVSAQMGLQQIFQNIISNAIKYNDKEVCQITLACQELTNQLQFSISDNGPGIPKAYHEKIFGIFQTLQARDTVESTGIGLSIVKKQVENLGGNVWIDSESGKGATFHFTIKR